MQLLFILLYAGLLVCQILHKEKGPSGVDLLGSGSGPEIEPELGFTDSEFSRKVTPLFTSQIYEPNEGLSREINLSSINSTNSSVSLVEPTTLKKKKKKKGLHLDAGVFFDIGKMSKNATANYGNMTLDAYNISFSNISDIHVLAMSDKDRQNKGLRVSAGVYFDVDLDKNQIKYDDEDCSKFWFWPYVVDMNNTNMTSADRRYEIPNKYLMSTTDEVNLFTSQKIEEVNVDETVAVDEVIEVDDIITEAKVPKEPIKYIQREDLMKISDFNHTEPPTIPFDKMITRANETSFSPGLRLVNSYDSSANTLYPSLLVIILVTIGCIV